MDIMRFRFFYFRPLKDAGFRGLVVYLEHNEFLEEWSVSRVHV